MDGVCGAGVDEVFVCRGFSVSGLVYALMMGWAGKEGLRCALGICIL